MNQDARFDIPVDKYLRKVLSLHNATHTLSDVAQKLLRTNWKGKLLEIQFVTLPLEKPGFFADLSSGTLRDLLIIAKNLTKAGAQTYIRTRIIEPLLERLPGNLFNPLQHAEHRTQLDETSTIRFSSSYSHCEAILIALRLASQRGCEAVVPIFWSLEVLLCAVSSAPRLLQ